MPYPFALFCRSCGLRTSSCAAAASSVWTFQRPTSSALAWWQTSRQVVGHSISAASRYCSSWPAPIASWVTKLYCQIRGFAATQRQLSQCTASSLVTAATGPTSIPRVRFYPHHFELHVSSCVPVNSCRNCSLIHVSLKLQCSLPMTGISTALLQVYFRPPNRQSYRDQLELFCGSNSICIPLEAVLPTSKLQLPSAIDFGCVPTKEPVVQRLPIKNVGDALLQFTWKLEQPFAIVPAAGQLAPGQTLICEVWLTVYIQLAMAAVFGSTIAVQQLTCRRIRTVSPHCLLLFVTCMNHASR